MAKGSAPLQLKLAFLLGLLRHTTAHAIFRANPPTELICINLEHQCINTIMCDYRSQVCGCYAKNGPPITCTIPDRKLCIPMENPLGLSLGMVEKTNDLLTCCPFFFSDSDTYNCLCLSEEYIKGKDGSCQPNPHGTYCDNQFDCGTGTYLICNEEERRCECNETVSEYDNTEMEWDCRGMEFMPCDGYGKQCSFLLECDHKSSDGSPVCLSKFRHLTSRFDCDIG
ncbi:unnamed protein product [Orchesella dallaii]|uniref:Uncharacterized protein n=1 Tax=Orchesella dallaii TaxID=48710 RepID=A0ABP1PSK4_9HEXA